MSRSKGFKVEKARPLNTRLPTDFIASVLRPQFASAYTAYQFLEAFPIADLSAAGRFMDHAFGFDASSGLAAECWSLFDKTVAAGKEVNASARFIGFRPMLYPTTMTRSYWMDGVSMSVALPSFAPFDSMPVYLPADHARMLKPRMDLTGDDMSMLLTIRGWAERTAIRRVEIAAADVFLDNVINKFCGSTRMALNTLVGLGSLLRASGTEEVTIDAASLPYRGHDWVNTGMLQRCYPLWRTEWRTHRDVLMKACVAARSDRSRVVIPSNCVVFVDDAKA